MRSGVPDLPWADVRGVGRLDAPPTRPMRDEAKPAQAGFVAARPQARIHSLARPPTRQPHPPSHTLWEGARG